MMPKSALQRSSSALAAPDQSPAIPAVAPEPADEEQARSDSTELAHVKHQAFDALNAAVCEHIYSTALQHLNQHYNEDAVGKQFVDILDKDDDPCESSCSIANQSGNSGKNRYRDVIPYDHNRVLLPVQRGHPFDSNAATCSSSSSSGSHALNSNSSLQSSIEDITYINASYMGDPHLLDDSSNSVLGYIATQGPLPNTVADFWRMAAATNSSAIVMLTALTDGSPVLGNSRPRCAAYFPDQQQDCLCLPGGITVTCVHKSNLDENVCFRQLEVVWTNSPTQHHLWINHYQYSAWPDFGVPLNTFRTSIVPRLGQLQTCWMQDHSALQRWCRATGTFVAIDILLQRLERLELQLHGSVKDEDVCAAMDISALVLSLRKQRRGTVQTVEQYSYIWRVVMTALTELLERCRQRCDT